MPQPTTHQSGGSGSPGSLASTIGGYLSRVPIPWILALAFVVRAVFVIAFALTSNWPNYGPLEGPQDSQGGVDGYIQIARTLFTSGEYAFAPGEDPVPFRPPFVPFLMLLFGAWSTHHWFWVWLVYSVGAGTFTLWVVHRCALEMSLGALSTRIVLLAVALHPYLIFSTRVPALPVTLTLICTMIAWTTLRFIKRRGRHGLGLGLAWGIGALTHGSFLPLMAPYFLSLMFLSTGSWKRRLRDLSIASLTCLVLVAPWTLRNQITFGSFIPVATGSGLQYWLGDAIYFRGDRRIVHAFERVKIDFKERTGRDLLLEHGGVLNLTDDEELSRSAKSQLSADPAIAIKRLLVGLPLFWTTMDGGWRKTMIVATLNLPIILVFIVTFITLLVRSRGNRTWFACCFFLLGYWALFALVQAVGPYFVSVIPCLLLLLVSGIPDAFRRDGLNGRDRPLGGPTLP